MSNRSESELAKGRGHKSYLFRILFTAFIIFGLLISVDTERKELLCTEKMTGIVTALDWRNTSKVKKWSADVEYQVNGENYVGNLTITTSHNVDAPWTLGEETTFYYNPDRPKSIITTAAYDQNQNTSPAGRRLAQILRIIVGVGIAICIGSGFDRNRVKAHLARIEKETSAKEPNQSDQNIPLVSSKKRGKTKIPFAIWFLIPVLFVMDLVVLVFHAERLFLPSLLFTISASFVLIGIGLLQQEKETQKNCTVRTVATITGNEKERMCTQRSRELDTVAYTYHPVLCYYVNGEKMEQAYIHGIPSPMEKDSHIEIIYNPQRPEEFCFLDSEGKKIGLIVAYIILAVGVLIGIIDVLIFFLMY